MSSPLQIYNADDACESLAKATQMTGGLLRIEADIAEEQKHLTSVF